MSLATLPVSVPPAMLTSIATGLASSVDPDDLGFALDDDRGYARLLHTDAYEAWLIAWAPGGSLDLHDHGGSAGEVVVVEGELLERYTDRRFRRPPPHPPHPGRPVPRHRSDAGPRRVEPWSGDRPLRPRVLATSRRP